MSQSKHPAKDMGKKDIKKSHMLAGMASGLDQHAHQTLRGHGQTQHGSASREKKPGVRFDPTIRGPTRMAKMDQTMAPAPSRMPKMDKTMKPAETSRMPKMDKTMKPAESSRMSKMDKTMKPTDNSRMPKIDKTVRPTDNYKTMKATGSPLVPKPDKTTKHGAGSTMTKIDKTMKPGESSKMGKMDKAVRAAESSGMGRMDRSAAPRPPSTITYTTQRDQDFASRQTRIEQLSPQDQMEQEQWAQIQLQASAVCPAGFVWMRRPGGYQCYGGAHWVSDDSLASGVIVVEDSGAMLMRNRFLDHAARIRTLNQHAVAKINRLDQHEARVNYLHHHLAQINMINQQAVDMGGYGCHCNHEGRHCPKHGQGY